MRCGVRPFLSSTPPPPLRAIPLPTLSLLCCFISPFLFTSCLLGFASLHFFLLVNLSFFYFCMYLYAFLVVPTFFLLVFSAGRLCLEYCFTSLLFIFECTTVVDVVGRVGVVPLSWMIMPCTLDSSTIKTTYTYGIALYMYRLYIRRKVHFSWYCPFRRLFVALNQSARQRTNQSTNQPINQSINQVMARSISQSMTQSRRELWNIQ